MKKLGFFLVMIGYITTCYSANNSTSGKSKVRLEKYSNIEILTPIYFGNIITDGKAGNVIMQTNTSGTLATTNSAFILDGNGTSGSIQVFGSTGETAQITIPTKIGLTLLSDKSYKLSFLPTISSTNLTISSTEENNIIYLGGTLEIPEKVPDGRYNGTVELTIAY